MNLQPHPLALLFPPMPEDEFLELALDIKRHGQLEPIELLDGKILDGVNRYKAALKAGVTPKTVVWKNSDGRDAALAHVLSRNVRRRHLTAGQVALIVMDANSELAAKIGKEKGTAPGSHVAVGTRRGVESAPGTVSDRSAAEQLAAKAGVAVRSIQQVARVRREAPELEAMIRSGEMSPKAAEQQIAYRKAQASIDATREAKTKRDMQWQTHFVKDFLKAIDRFNDELDKQPAALKAGKYAPEAKPFVVRKLQKTAERITKIQKEFEK